MNRGRSFFDALIAEPWLKAYVDDADETVEFARRRFERSQKALLRRMERDGVELHRRVTKAGGLLTTSLDEKGLQR